MAGERLHTLDGMRGLAAIGVVLFHLDFVGIHLAASGYLAVDFFFALSGLVVAIAYEERLRDAIMRPARFMLIRLIRLYPLYVLGTFGGLTLVAAGVAFGQTRGFSPGSAPAEVIGALLMLPDPWSPLQLYPFNGPAWSLLLELVVNLVFAILLVRLKAGWLATIWLAALAVYAVKVDHAWARGYGSNLGPYWGHVSAGMARVIAGFAFGMLMKRWGVWRGRRQGWLAILPVALLLGMLASPPSRWLDLSAIGVLIPICVAAASRMELPAWLHPACALLGDLSYPLYAIHFPMIFLVDLGCRAAGVTGGPEAVAILAAALATAWLLVPADAVIRERIMAVIGHRSRAAAPAQ